MAKKIRRAARYSAVQSCYLLFLWAAVAFAASSADLERAAQLYQRTEYEKALRVLEASKDKGPATYALIGKSHYRLGKFKEASEALEKAVAGDPTNSQYVNWLGKAFGRRAETSFFLTAPSYATKARQHFERAVELDPTNWEALSDLFEYYLEAPGFLGGGQEKAAELSERIRELDLAEYHHMQAHLAEKQKDFQSAEEHLRRAAELAPSEMGRTLDLAKFLAEQGKYPESEQAFKRAEQLAPESPQIKFERAKAYIRAGQNGEVARRLLEQYLNSPLTPDDPPRSEAERLLKETARS